ncbi:hypothetical protein LJR084_001865 [Variovorax sp. LjRoot84]|uniref:hypothetical protein n=1 Tax=Variovorax sp. LjRoot84 TaxID=3342340 RepID=UPI003ECF1127
MSFQLEEVTQILVTNANPRRELHGEERVRAIDIAFSVKGENTLLDLIEPGLREHHYFNKALKDGQEALPGVIIPLPNLRYPKLPQAYSYAKGEKYRGYRFIWDWGTDGAHVDFTDVVLANLHYELHEGGSVTIMGTIQYNGEELQDNDVYGELSGLASEGEIYAKLLAPAELIPVKKGYRAGKPDTPPADQPPGDGSGGEPDAGDIFAAQHGKSGGSDDDTDDQPQDDAK